MASLVKSKSMRGTHWRIDFFLAGDPKRKHIRLGKMTERQAESITTKVELLIAAKATGTSPDLDVSRWVAERDSEFHDKLADHGLVSPRARVEVTTLAEFLNDYMAKRKTLLDAGKLKVAHSLQRRAGQRCVD